MSGTNAAESQFSVVEKNQQADKASHYLNLRLKDAEGNEIRVNAGIALGGRNEKGISPALIANFEANPDYEYTLVGTIRSAEPEIKDIKF